MHPILNTAVKAARRAGNIINRAAQNLDILSVTQKAINDFVSEVDHEAEHAIIKVLLDAYPSHSILAEESGAAGKSEFKWIIDPLDGTTNFLHGFPQYAVSIALAHKGVMTQAVIYDPVRNDLFTASRGSGAYLNDHRIRVSKRLKLQQSLLGTGFPFREFAHIDAYLRTAARGGGNTRSCLRCGGTPRRLLGIRPESVGHGGGQPVDHRSRRTGRRSRRQQHLS
jgi:myo-inositol-1(or 4)-monophosphatase